jgi:predicted nucleotidyltransferase
MSSQQVIAKLRSHETELRRAGILHLSLFGSVARGEDRPDSDIDLAAVLDKNAHMSIATRLRPTISNATPWSAAPNEAASLGPGFPRRISNYPRWHNGDTVRSSPTCSSG